MSHIYDALPGLEVPPGGISRALAGLWLEQAANGLPAPASDDVKAAQLNLVLHFGFAATPEDALAQFRSVVEFTSRYPGRVVVLCPRVEGGSGLETRAKIYGECFLGKSKGDTRCCEFVLLNYSVGARLYLENQVSVCLDPDVPLYFWAHRFKECRRMADYQWLLTQSRRFVYDSAAVPGEALVYPWPNPRGVRDLAFARTLPLRQSIGQFLSRYEPAVITGGLRSVTCSFEDVHEAEGRALRRWLGGRLAACGAEADALVWNEARLPHGGGTCFSIEFGYGEAKRFHWRGDCTSGVSHFSADLGGGATELPSHISLLPQAQALAEALFM
jgi:hypothetical protein